MHSNSIDLKKKKELSLVIMLLIILLVLLLMITTFTFESIFGISSPGKGKYQIKFDGDGIPDININKEIITDINIDTNGDGIPDINIDTDGNGIPDLNIDFNKDGKPDVNIDTNGDNKGDKNKINTDTNDNGRADLNIDMDGDGYPDVNIDIDGDDYPDINIDTDFWKTKVEALFTIITADNINLNVTAAELSKEAVGNNEYLEISSKTEKTRIALKSNGDTTTCKYTVSFVTNENTFENRYLTNSGALGTLKNQVMLRLKGFEMVDGVLTPKTYDIDLNEYKNSDYIIKDILITNKETDNDTTEHSWDINLIFRNYRDYNQTNNANKKVVGELNFNITECERIVKG